MMVKRILVAVPLVVIVVLLQSYFWVPSYERQTTGNPERVEKFISASIGDARLLNPILSVDTASGQVVDYVFDSLLKLDEGLVLSPHLAESWEITSIAILAVHPGVREAEELRARVHQALDQGKLLGLVDVINRVEILPAEAVQEVWPEDGTVLPESPILVSRPARLRFELSRVVPDFFDRLEPLVGAGYLENFPWEAYVQLPNVIDSVQKTIFQSFVPVVSLKPVLEFVLRQGVRFHDGQPFDSHDVKFTYDAIMNPRNLSPRTSDFEPIESVEVLGSHSIRVTYKRLFSPAIYGWSYMGILPEHLLNTDALEREMDDRGIDGTMRRTFGIRDSRFNRAPVGTGPFRFIDWQSDEFIHVQRNDTYFDDPPEYRDVFIRVVPDLVTQELEFRSGAVDIYGVQPHQADRYKKDSSYQAFSSVGFGYTYIGYNNRKPPFDDVRVRQALGMAINVDQIIEYVLYGEGERVTGPYANKTEWYDHGVDFLPYDPDRAQQILAELGWSLNQGGLLEKDGQVFEFTLITNNGNPLRKAVVAIAQNAWKKLGIRCTTQLFEWSVFLKDFVTTGEFDAVVLGWATGVDPDQFQIWHSSQSGPQQLNFIGYDNPEADRLIEAIRLEYDGGRQRRLAHRLHRTIAHDQPYTFLYAARGTTVVDRKVVMLERDETGEKHIKPLRPTPTGNLNYYFNRWKKLAFVPEF